MVNNSVSNSYSVVGNCEVGGGGVSLVLCNASISGNVVANIKQQGKWTIWLWWRIYLYESNVCINESDMEKDNINTFTAVSQNSNQASACVHPP